LSENALKLIYGNVDFQNFPARTPVPRVNGGKGGREEWKRDEGWGGEGRGRGCGGRKGRDGRKGLKEREGKRRKGGGEGERNLDPPMFQTDRRQWLIHCCRG
jgi:hypothetical protein